MHFVAVSKYNTFSTSSKSDRNFVCTGRKCKPNERFGSDKFVYFSLETFRYKPVNFSIFVLTIHVDLLELSPIHYDRCSLALVYRSITVRGLMPRLVATLLHSPISITIEDHSINHH